MQTTRFAVCGKDSCGNEWQLEKSLEEYTDGPRCPKCGSRRIELEGEETVQRPTSAVVFEALESGQPLVDIVQQEEIAPDEVERLAEKFEQLSEQQLMDENDIAEIREAAYQRGKEKGRDEGYHDGKKEGIQKGREIARNEWIGQAKDQAHLRGQIEGYDAGFEEGHEKGYSDAMTECDDRLQEARSEMEQEKEQLQLEYEKKLESARNEGFEEGKDLAFEKARQDGYETGYNDAVEDAENEQFADTYVEGVRHGVIIGEQNATEEGKVEGMAKVLEIISD